MTVFTVGSGESGVGRSALVASLGVALAREGVRVALVDLDLDSSDLHLFLGVDPAGSRLRDAIAGRCELRDAQREVEGHPGLSLVPGCVETLRAASLKEAEISRLVRGLRRLDVEVVLVDLPGGVCRSVLELFTAGDRPLVISGRSDDAARAAARLVHLARLHRSSRREKRAPEPGEPRVYTNLDDLVRDMNAIREEEVAQRPQSFRPRVVLSRAAPGSEIPDALVTACAGIEPLASVPEDPQLEQAARIGVPVVDFAPGAPSSVAIRRLAEMIRDDTLAAAAQDAPLEPDPVFA